MMISDNELLGILKLIEDVYGYDFSNYSEASFKRRLIRFMKMKEFDSVGSLLQKLLNDEYVFEEFIQGITVNVTEMFRDPSFYLSLRKDVVPRLSTYPFIKIWIAGCSTGEELYSVAIMLKEEGILDRSIIYATDINQQVLKSAKEGMYNIKFMKDYIANYQKAGGKNSFSDYYIAKYNSALIDKSLKNNVVFSVHNLVTDQSFNEFQLILCRNVLIYFNQELQDNVINLFYDSLCKFGYLGLGSKESLHFTDKRKNFEEINRKERIYMKTD